MIKYTFLFLALGFATQAQSDGFKQDVANAYNDGIVRCSNDDCARYLYACFRTYAQTTLNEFLACGQQASRLNGNQFVVAAPRRG